MGLAVLFGLRLRRKTIIGEYQLLGVSICQLEWRYNEIVDNLEPASLIRLTVFESPKIDIAIFLSSQAALKAERRNIQNLIIVSGIPINDPQLKSRCIYSLHNLPNLCHVLFLVSNIDHSIACIGILERVSIRLCYFTTHK